MDEAEWRDLRGYCCNKRRKDKDDGKAYVLSVSDIRRNALPFR